MITIKYFLGKLFGSEDVSLTKLLYCPRISSTTATYFLPGMQTMFKKSNKDKFQILVLVSVPLSAMTEIKCDPVSY